MDTQQVSAPSRAPSRVRGSATPSSGVVHINSRHASRFTVIGNHLTQHRELSLLAIGLAAHIQSLPTGAKIGIRFLADRFPESETRIAAALRELEAHGYLQRTRTRLASGQVVTRTLSYNQPASHGTPATAPLRHPRTRPSRQAPRHTPVPAPVREQPLAPAPVPDTAPTSAPQPDRQAATPAPAPETTPASPVPEQAPTPPAPPRPPLPEPRVADPARHDAAAELLAGLRRHEPRLLLAEKDVRRLAPAVAAWLERDAHPDAVRHSLTSDLPEHLNHPVGLLAHRLTAHLPSPLPAAPTPASAPRPHPFQDCDGCDRPFRAPEPGRCRDCHSRGSDATT
ncbi:helix-turn-helix domain-containing protein [Streptomyces sp. NPDC005078]|uniref:helix-turn-helix domain-containing protein n=1 Tax=unclassified Streptomyces TaxID=2593676 RepID=UPI0033B34501